MLATTGMDWLIASRTPFPRLRGADVLVVPANKLPQTSSSSTSASTTYTYVCYSGTSYFGGVSLATATRFTSASIPTSADCVSRAGSGYPNPILV